MSDDPQEIQTLRQALAFSPENTALRMHFADTLIKYGRFAEAEAEYGVAPVATLEQGAYDAIVVAVAHNEFKAMGVEAIRALGKPGAVLYDVKAMFPQGAADLRL